MKSEYRQSARLHIKIAFDTSVSHYVGKVIEVPETLAKEKRINPGVHEVGIIWETQAKGENAGALKVSYRGSAVWLPKDAVRIIEVTEKGIFDFDGEY